MVLALLFSLQVQAQDFTLRSESECNSTDPSMTEWYFDTSQSLSPLDEKIGEVRNQGDTQWCFAYAAADLLTQHLGIYVSAPQLAFIYFNSTLLGNLESSIGDHGAGDLPPLLQATRKKSLCPESQFLQSTDYDALSEAQCQGPGIPAKPYRLRHHGVWPGNGYLVFNKLDQALLEGKIVGVQYKVEKALHVPYDDDLQRFWANLLGSDHVSSVVARHWNSKNLQCEYLIRNTWGTGCYTPNCKRGYYSVSEYLLSKSMVDISYLQ